MHEIGFSEGDIAFALQLASDNFAKALGHRVSLSTCCRIHALVSGHAPGVFWLFKGFVVET